MNGKYSIIQHPESSIEYRVSSIQNLEISLNGTLTTKQINRFARQRGFITEVNADQGFIELFDNELRQIAILERIFI